MMSQVSMDQQSIEELQQSMQKGEFSAVELTLEYMRKIAENNQQGASLAAVIEINPDALFLAEAMDRERHRTGLRGPLHGIPVLIKDNINTADAMHTSAGSMALAKSYAGYDAFLVRKLRAAGAILLGKTNLTEWANFMADHMPNGYSSRGGQTLNPYGPGRLDVGGSSAGSGSAIAADFATAAIGTETSGSILSPSSQNSLVGIKPTVGLVSRRGIIPIAYSQDTAGPMTRTVRDAALLLNVIAGVDPDDAATLTSQGQILDDYTAGLTPEGLNRARIGVVKQFFSQLNDSQNQLMQAAFDVLRKQGAIVIEDLELIDPEEGDAGYEVLIYEFKSALNAYLKELPHHVSIRSLQDVIRFNEKDPERLLKFGQQMLLRAEATSGTLTDAEYLNARRRDLHWSRQQNLDRLMAEHSLDALVSPGYFASSIAAKAGYPSVTVPAGYDDEGMPWGLTFTGCAFSEARLLQLAYAYEQATLHRQAPKLSYRSEN